MSHNIDRVSKAARSYVSAILERGPGGMVFRSVCAALTVSLLAGCVSFPPAPFNAAKALKAEPAAGTSLVVRITFATNSPLSSAPILFKAPGAAALQEDIARFRTAASNVVIRDSVSAALRLVESTGLMNGPPLNASQGMSTLKTLVESWQQFPTNGWPAMHSRLALERAAYMRYSINRAVGMAEHGSGAISVYGPGDERIGDAGYTSKRGCVSFMYRINGTNFVFHEARTWVQTVRERGTVLDLTPTNTIAWADFLDALYVKMRGGKLNSSMVQSRPKDVELLASVDGHILPVQRFPSLHFAVKPLVIICIAQIGKREMTLYGSSALDLLLNLCLMNQVAQGRDLSGEKAYAEFLRDFEMERDRLLFVPEIVTTI